MSAITTNSSILAVAKQAIEQLLKFKGVPVELVPRRGVVTDKPGGGQDFTPPAPRPPQLLAISQIGEDIISDAETDGEQVVLRNYVGTGRFNMDIAIDDTWEDDAAEYRVESLDKSSGFKTSVTIVGHVKLVL